MGLEARRLFELGTIDALIDSLAGRVQPPGRNRGALARARAPGGRSELG